MTVRCVDSVISPLESFFMHGKDDGMKIIIDTPVYDELAEYCKKTNEPLSMAASKAIKKYINME